MTQYPNLNYWQTIYCWRSIVWQLGQGKGPGSPDFALIAFKDRMNMYFLDILVQDEREVPSEHDDYCHWSEESEQEYQEQVRFFRLKSFPDQNGFQVHDGAVYGIDEQGEFYELEPLVPFHASEY